MVHLQFFIAVCLAVALTGAECKHLPDSQRPVPRNSTPCSLEPANVCSSLQDTDNYSLQLEVHSSGHIKVRVHSTRCVLMGAPLPWWYQVEVVERAENGSADGSGGGPAGSSSSTSRPGGQCSAGRLQVAARKQEMTLCKNDSRVVFSTCSPNLLDLPRHLTFHPDDSKCAENDTLCFRLTLQETGEGRACLEKEVCMQLPTWPPKRTPSNAVVGDSRSRSVGHTTNSLFEVIHPPSMVGIGSGVGVGSGDGSEHADLEDDQEMIQEIINNMVRMGGKTEEIPAKQGCHKAKALYTSYELPWVPDCDCNGYYKDIQCAESNSELKCWCSTPSGSEVYDSKKTINCRDPQSLEFKC